MAAALSLALTVGCSAAEDYDQTELETARRALPSRAVLTASVPTADSQAVPLALGEPALYPTASRDIVTGINGTVGATLDAIEFVFNQTPSAYRLDTREFVWGPYPDDDGVGFFAAYLKDTGEDEDLRYHFAVLRGTSGDLGAMDSFTPVLLGGGTPDPAHEDRGVGVLLWDFTADNEFRSENDPAFDLAASNQGRFASAFGKGQLEEGEGEGELTFVVAAFRDFVSEGSSDQAPADLDYLYGRVENGDTTLDFIDYETSLDANEPADGVRETIGVRMAFLNEGAGRAEIDAMGGSLEGNDSISGVECWGPTLNETYLHLEQTTDEGQTTITLGEPASCGLFSVTLTEMKIPALEDLDDDILSILDKLARDGAL